jgi:hypothetical protein
MLLPARSTGILARGLMHTTGGGHIFDASLNGRSMEWSSGGT